MVQISIDGAAQADIKAFMDALARYEKETSRSMKDAIRSAAIDLVKSLRARTRKAPKIVARTDVRFGESDPKYITGTKGGANGTLFRRVVVMRWSKGRVKQHVHWQRVGYKYRSRKTANGISESRTEAKSAMLRDARKNFGNIRQWGLARKSWGWFMKSLFGQSVQDENPKALIKAGMVDRTVTDNKNEYSITIRNRLDYIMNAMPSGVLSVALQKATRLINHKIDSGFRSRRFKA